VFYRKSGRKKSRLSASSALRAAATSAMSGLATRDARAYVAGQGQPRDAAGMNQPLVQTIGFVVLVAILLATGFGALGAAPPVVF
jgi:hypothetical protein